MLSESPFYTKIGVVVAAGQVENPPALTSEISAFLKKVNFVSTVICCTWMSQHKYVTYCFKTI